MTQEARSAVQMATTGDVFSVAQESASSRDFGVTLNRIYFLDLKPIRLALGHTRWLSRRAVVHAVTKSCIRRFTHQDDIMVQLGDEQYVLIFANDDVERIAGTGKQIVDAVETKLFGEKSLNRVVIRDAANVFAEGAVRPDEDDDDAAARDEAAPAGPATADPPARPAAKMQSVSGFSEVTREACRSRLMEMLTEEEDESLRYGYMPIWHTRLQEITADLSHWIRSIAVTIPMSECATMQVLGMRAWKFRRANIGVVGVELDTQDVDESLQRAKRLADVLAPRGRRLAAMNVATASAPCELAINDYSFLSGTAIGRSLPEPKPPYEFTMHDLECAPGEDLGAHPAASPLPQSAQVSQRRLAAGTAPQAA